MKLPNKDTRNKMASISNQLIRLVQESTLDLYYERYVNIETRVRLLLTKDGKISYLKSQYDKLLEEWDKCDDTKVVAFTWREFSPIERICKEQVWAAYKEVNDNITFKYVLEKYKNIIDAKVNIIIIDHLLRNLRKEIEGLSNITSKDLRHAPKDEREDVSYSLSQVKIKQNAITQLYSILIDYFPEGQGELLLDCLKGTNDGTEKLTFMEQGNKLAYAFRQLYDASLIVGCKKNDLEQWIERNFRYKGRNGGVTNFTLSYLNDIISSNKGCQSPILTIQTINGHLEIKARIRTRKKNDII